MELKAKIVQLLPLQQGEGKNGPWKKQEVVVETDGQYPKKVLFVVWGDKINEQILRPGNVVNFFFDIEAREYNGRWYNDVKVWKMEPIGATTDMDMVNQAIVNEAPQDFLPDDLPF